MNNELPPHDIEAEQAVLGSILIDNVDMGRISAFLRPEDFFNPENQLIYEACIAINLHAVGIDQITLARELSGRGRLEEVGGTAYLSHLISMVPTSLHIVYYAQIVSKLAMSRRLISAGNQIMALGYDPDIEVDAALERAGDILGKVRQLYNSRYETQGGGVEM